MQAFPGMDDPPDNLPEVFQKTKKTHYIYYAVLLLIIVSALQSSTRTSLAIVLIDSYGNDQHLNTGIVLGIYFFDGISPL
jgi:hypothetical protein